MEIDDDVITFDLLSNISSLLPNQDVFEQILTYDGPMELLGKADTFVRNIYRVPRIKERLETMNLRLRFYQEFVELEPVFLY
jgi:hypothetical protein